MNNMDKKIVAAALPLAHIFEREHYVIDVYQRDYKWQRKQVEALLDDLYYNFINSLKQTEYGGIELDTEESYFMGSIVVSQLNKEMSIVDGQQRLTTFTLLFIFLHNLCQKLGINDDVDLLKYIYYKRSEKPIFSLDISERQQMVSLLLENNENWRDKIEIGNDESISNMVDAYQQILEDFPLDLRNSEKLPLFIEWLLFQVILVRIVAYTSEKAYTIFETMNDRGLSLTPAEILKGYIFNQVGDENKTTELNNIWKSKINSIIQQEGENSDSEFFKAWFRAKYAETVRSSNTLKEDFESIGAHYHTWFKNSKRLNLHTPQDYYFFVKGDFDFYTDLYIRIKKHQWTECLDELREIYITSCYPMADSLYLPLLMSPLSMQDSDEEIANKMFSVNNFVDEYINLKTLSNQSIAQTAIKNNINNIILEIRNSDVNSLKEKLREEKEKSLQFELVSLDSFSPGLSYIHYFLARMRMFYDKNTLFSALLRTKRQSSLIAVPIATYNELVEINNESNVSLYHHILINYCLIRRNQQYVFTQLTLQERIKWLKDNNYLLEMKNESLNDIDILSFYECRKKRFEEFIDRTWLKTK